MNVCHALTSLRGTYIQWPNRHQLPTIAEQWSEKAGIPGVVGVIDGTYIPIPGPCDATRDAYICRKGFPAMHVQVIYCLCIFPRYQKQTQPFKHKKLKTQKVANSF